MQICIMTYAIKIKKCIFIRLSIHIYYYVHKILIIPAILTSLNVKSEFLIHVTT